MFDGEFIISQVIPISIIGFLQFIDQLRQQSIWGHLGGWIVTCSNGTFFNDLSPEGVRECPYNPAARIIVQSYTLTEC